MTNYLFNALGYAPVPASYGFDGIKDLEGSTYIASYFQDPIIEGDCVLIPYQRYLSLLVYAKFSKAKPVVYFPYGDGVFCMHAKPSENITYRTVNGSAQAFIFYKLKQKREVVNEHPKEIYATEEVQRPDAAADKQ